MLYNLGEKLLESLSGQLKTKQSETKINETPTYQKRKKYFELVKYLHIKGYSQRLIARVLGLARGTVRRYIADAEVPDWQPRQTRPNQLDVHEKYLRTRWQEGCREVTLLWKELQQQGYTGPRKPVARYLQRFKEKILRHSIRQLVWLFMQNKDELETEERQSLNTLLVENPSLGQPFDAAGFT